MLDIRHAVRPAEPTETAPATAPVSNPSNAPSEKKDTVVSTASTGKPHGIADAIVQSPVGANVKVTISPDVAGSTSLAQDAARVTTAIKKDPTPTKLDKGAPSDSAEKQAVKMPVDVRTESPAQEKESGRAKENSRQTEARHAQRDSEVMVRGECHNVGTNHKRDNKVKVNKEPAGQKRQMEKGEGGKVSILL